MPKTVLQQVVSYYSRSAQNPSGVNLDDAFELAGAIREIRVQPGQAIVVNDIGLPRLARPHGPAPGNSPRRRIDAPLADLHGVGAAAPPTSRRPARHPRRSSSSISHPLRRSQQPQPIAALKPGGNASVVGEVIGAELKRTRRPGFTVFELRVRDDSGTLTAVFFNQRFLRDVFHRHQQVALFGKVELTGHGVQMQSPQYEILADTEESRSTKTRTRGIGRSRCITDASCRFTNASAR